MKKGLLKVVVLYWMIGWAILIVGRLALVALFVSLAEVQSCTQFLPLALWNAARFDFQTLAYLAALPVVILIAASYCKRVWTKLESFLRGYYTVCYTLLSCLVVADLAYYKNFLEHFNITVFDFFNEEPLTLVQAFWQEYPVLWIVVAIALVAWILWKVGSLAVIGREQKPLGWREAGWSLLAVAMVFVCMRGSVVEFPLQVEDMYVSPSKPFNDCVPNAAYCLKKAWSEKKKAFKLESEETLLKRYGFASTDEAWQVLGREDQSLFGTIGNHSKTDSLGWKPNIILIVSESWSGYLCEMGLKRQDDDLLCGMRRHLTEDLLFQNYQSVQNGTIATIENLLIATSFPRVFMSKYRYEKFPTSFATPFVESGYHATFMSGMDEGWENVGIGLQAQGFSKVFKYELLDAHPEYTANSIGVFDHHLMNSLMEHMLEVNGEPELCVVMTTTNHPPFTFPDDMKLPALPDDFYSHPAFANKPDVEAKYIRGFQYASQSMAAFLDQFKQSPLAQNTIVMITGDHNVRTALDYADDGEKAPTRWMYSVPLYVYLPPALRGTEDDSYRCNTQKFGCHYDLIPTLAPFAFDRDVPYLSVGQDLLADSLTEANSYSYNIASVLYNHEANPLAEKKAQARELLLRLFHQQFFSKKVNSKTE